MPRGIRLCLLCLIGVIAGNATPTIADAGNLVYEQAVRAYVQATIEPWVRDPSIVAAIKTQNTAFANLSSTEILAYDKEWRAEAARGGGPLIQDLLARRLSRFLKSKQSESQGVISEIFVMDDHALNVAQSVQTTDYWQGDEAKFLQTYTTDSRTWFVDHPQRDESNTLMDVQASVTIRDANGARIGAIAVTLRLDAL
jgi:hypothetical protein